MKLREIISDRQQLSWSFYDWANSAFATTVMAGFFPFMFKGYWGESLSTSDSTFYLGLGNSLASLLVVLLAPLLGAIADQFALKKRLLFTFALLGISMTAALSFAAEGAWALAIALYVLATVGFMGGNIFYDSLLVDVAPQNRQRHLVSAVGFALGYLGGGILFSVNVAMTVWPQAFGFADRDAAAQAAFVSVAIWWAVFSLPLLWFVKEQPVSNAAPSRFDLTAGFRALADTFKQVRRLRMAFLFLLAYWFYIDGVDTVVRMAVDYGMSLGFDGNTIIIALLVTQFVGFPAAIIYGKFGERVGAKRALFVGIGIYMLVVAWASQMQNLYEFYGLAIAIGLVQGGIQSLSRSLYSTLIPVARAGQFFGFYNMLGKFAVLFGPLLMGWVSVLTQNPRFAILSLLVLFGLGAILLSRVDVARGQTAAAELPQ